MRYLLIIIMLITPAYGAEILNENFDLWTTGWTCPTASENPNMSVWDCAPLAVSCNGDSRPFLSGQGITANGRSGKAMQYPRSTCDPNNYYGDLNINLYSALGGPHKELYIRWTMKFDNGFDKSFSSGFKLMDRIMLRTSEGTESVLYPSLRGGKVSSANIAIAGPASGSYFYDWVTLANNSLFYPDHNWHSIEIRIKLNSNGVADGAIQTWVDGTLATSYTGVIVVPSGDYYFNYMRFGLGNVSDAVWDQQTFKSLYYDDLVISTTYVGPVGSSPPAETCSDGIQNQGETGVDCGGPCTACASVSSQRTSASGRFILR